MMISNFQMFLLMSIVLAGLFAVLLIVTSNSVDQGIITKQSFGVKTMDSTKRTFTVCLAVFFVSGVIIINAIEVRSKKMNKINVLSSEKVATGEDLVDFDIGDE